MEAGATLGQGEVRFHESRFLNILSTVAPSDKEKFDLTVSLIVLAHSDISLLDANSLFGRLFGFTLDRVSPDFALPKSVSSLFLRMGSRDSLHDQFFRFKFVLLSRLINSSTNVVAIEDLLDQYRACASSYLMELNSFTYSLLEGRLVEKPTEFLVEYCCMCYDFLSNRDSQLNSEFCIKSTLRIVFFESAHVDKGVNSARVGLMKKLLTIAEENHPLIGRYSVPLFVEFLKRSTVIFSDNLIDLICDLITHKEGFDESQVEGLEFGLNQVKRGTPLSASVEATSAYTRILTLTVIRELNDVELVDRIAVNLLDRILTAQIEIEKKGVPQTPLPFTAFHRSQLRIYQAVAYLAPLVSQETFSKKIEDNLFGPLLQWSNQPDARDYLETLAIFFIDRFRLPLQSVISVLKNYNLPSQAIASFVVIGGYAVRDEKLKLDERRELALHLIPFLSSNVSYIRGVSQQWLSAVHAQGLMEQLGLDNPIINNIIAFMSQNKESIQLRKKLTPVFAFWDPIESIRSGKILALCASGAMFKNSELVPCLVFMDAVREGVHEAMKDNWFFTRDFDTLINDHIVATRDSKNSEEKFPISNSQRKYVPQIGSLFPGLEQESKTRRAMTELVVVTTLVEKSTNIAGLCRSAEVFGAKRLVVPKLSVLKESQFSAMSVTAEQWIDVQEVTETRLSLYLSEMKSVGYTVVCLEQTHDSVEIQDYEFPEKCCLVLGNEKSGVPVEFLPCMDVCVEIPQRGVIRSLNVHVSGAIAMWQYNRFR
jgi:tRNA G18 (ribose-2'-O)-methylase SpoU